MGRVLNIRKRVFVDIGIVGHRNQHCMVAVSFMPQVIFTPWFSCTRQLFFFNHFTPSKVLILLRHNFRSWSKNPLICENASHCEVFIHCHCLSPHTHTHTLSRARTHTHTWLFAQWLRQKSQIYFYFFVINSRLQISLLLQILTANLGGPWTKISGGVSFNFQK